VHAICEIAPRLMYRAFAQLRDSGSRMPRLPRSSPAVKLDPDGNNKRISIRAAEDSRIRIHASRESAREKYQSRSRAPRSIGPFAAQNGGPTASRKSVFTES